MQLPLQRVELAAGVPWLTVPELNRLLRRHSLAPALARAWLLEQLAERVAIIDGGTIVADGSPRELKERIGFPLLTVVAADGSVMYFKEGKVQSTYHVIAMPAGHAALEADFREFSAKTGRSVPTGLPVMAEAKSNTDFLHDEISW